MYGSFPVCVSYIVCLFVCQTQPQRVLDHPITVQAVGTNGRVFHFVVFQLNTTDLSGDEGIKNQVGCLYYFNIISL